MNENHGWPLARLFSAHPKAPCLNEFRLYRLPYLSHDNPFREVPQVGGYYVRTRNRREESLPETLHGGSTAVVSKSAHDILAVTHNELDSRPPPRGFWVAVTKCWSPLPSQLVSANLHRLTFFSALAEPRSARGITVTLPSVSSTAAPTSSRFTMPC